MPLAIAHKPVAWAVLSLVAPCLWASTAEIVSLSGKGEARAPQSAQWQSARINQRVAAGFFVRTGDQSNMALLFEDKTQMRLAQNSMFQIKPTEATGQPTTIQLRQGRAWTQSKGGPNRLMMETPSAIAAIQGTDWAMEVDPDGTTRLIVLHGEVRLYNAHGSLVVGAQESAQVSPGRAPVKLLLLNPADRVQWVRSYRVDVLRHAASPAGAPPPGPEAAQIAALLAQEETGPAFALAQRWAGQTAAPPLAALLLADFYIVEGDFDAAQRTLQEAQTRHPADPRLDAQRARIALMRGDADGARSLITQGLARHPQALELVLARAELALYEGQALAVRDAYEAARDQFPDDPRSWHGLGRLWSEREDYKTARPLLEKALALDARHPGTRGELATLLLQTHALSAASAQLDKALAERPDDYVALTGRGLLQLRQGQPQAALETLLQASVIEPRYARAVMYKAVAYHQLGRSDLALQTLAQAMELDPLDPVPHQLASLIHADRVEPAAAVAQAREALRLLPYLKSLNPVATNQRGAANLGSALADVGLQAWAQSYAQASFSPFSGASHLFLADQYRSRFAKQSELMQGFMTEPLAFGASGRRQDLLLRPGTHASASLQTSHDDNASFRRPELSLYGITASETPTAWLGEWLRIDMVPGDAGIRGRADNLTGAIGIKPRADLHLFAYGNRFLADATLPPDPMAAQAARSHETRLDLGLNYQFSPTHQTWIKLGGEQTVLSTAGHVGRQEDFQTRRQASDLQWRYSVRLGDDQPEWSLGAETARAASQQFNVASLPEATVRLIDSKDLKDRSATLYAQMRYALTPAWNLDAGLWWSHYRMDTDGVARIEQPGRPAIELEAIGLPPNQKKAVLQPRIGLLYQAAPGHHWRLAYQAWTRPAASGTLAPTTTAGVALDEQGVVAGGQLKRWRLQWDREISPSTFAMLFGDLRRIHNPGFPGAVANTATEINDLSRLRTRTELDVARLSEQDEQAVFQQGRIQQMGGAINHMATRQLATWGHYALTHGRNTSETFQGLSLPLVPRHRLAMGLTWTTAERVTLQAAATYRTRRLVDEMGSRMLPSGWDLALKARWVSEDRQWTLEGYVLNVLSKNAPAQVGLLGTWKY